MSPALLALIIIGVMIASPFTNRITMEALAELIRASGCDNVYLSTDLGQAKNPYFDEGLEDYAHLLMKQGFTEAELELMMKTNPARLLAAH